MSVGNTLRKTPTMYRQLKVIELYQVSFEDMKEIMVVLRLILNAPNLQELQISVSLLNTLTSEFKLLQYIVTNFLFICFV